MKSLSFFFFSLATTLHAHLEVVYVENHYTHSCTDVCSSKGLSCDDDVMDMMDCASAAMTYCNNKELTSYRLEERETCKLHECLVACGEGHYSDHGSTSARCVDQKMCSVYNSNFQAICPCIMHVSTYHNILTKPWVAGGLLALFMSLVVLLVYKGYRILRKKFKSAKTYTPLSELSSHSKADSSTHSTGDIELNLREKNSGVKTEGEHEKTENLVQKYVRTRSTESVRSSRYKKTDKAAIPSTTSLDTDKPRRYVRSQRSPLASS